MPDLKNKKIKYFIVIGTALFLTAISFCFYSSARIFDSFYDKEIREKDTRKENGAVIINLPEKSNYLIRISGNCTSKLPTTCKIIFNKHDILSPRINREIFKQEFFVVWSR